MQLVVQGGRLPVCRSHEAFVLQRHISRYQALSPGTKPAGVHKGEAFFPRQALAELHTAGARFCPCFPSLQQLHQSCASLHHLPVSRLPNLICVSCEPQQ